MKKEQKPDQDIQKLLSAGKIKAILCSPKTIYARVNRTRKAEVILFDDRETYVLLEEQDYYSYHDCSSSARQLEVRKDKEGWESYLRDYVPALTLT